MQSVPYNGGMAERKVHACTFTCTLFMALYTSAGPSQYEAVISAPFITSIHKLLSSLAGVFNDRFLLEE